MKITIFGATGRTGSQIVRKALHEHHAVSIMSRQLSRVCFDPELLTIYEGNVLSGDIVKKAIKGADLVISTIGADDISRPFRMISEGTKNIIDAMTESGIKRFVGMAGAGILNHPSGEYNGDVDLDPSLQYLFQDNFRAYKALNNSTLDWTLVCPFLMPAGPETGIYRISENSLPPDPKPVSVNDVASLIYKIAMEGLHIRTRVGVSL